MIKIGKLLQKKSLLKVSCDGTILLIIFRLEGSELRRPYVISGKANECEVRSGLIPQRSLQLALRDVLPRHKTSRELCLLRVSGL